MKAHERKQLLERVGRDGATVGTRIPERIEVRGEPVDLRAFVFEIKRRDTVPPGERDRVATVKRRLRRERRERLRTIEAGEISFEAGEELAESILGLDRALNALESLGSSDLEAEASAQATADRKRWASFLRQVLGHEDGRQSRS